MAVNIHLMLQLMSKYSLPTKVSPQRVYNFYIRL